MQRVQDRLSSNMRCVPKIHKCVPTKVVPVVKDKLRDRHGECGVGVEGLEGAVGSQGGRRCCEIVCAKCISVA